MSATVTTVKPSHRQREPRFFGYITASAAPIGILGDLLAAAVNPNVGAWSLSPVATEIEREQLVGVHVRDPERARRGVDAGVVEAHGRTGERIPTNAHKR